MTEGPCGALPYKMGGFIMSVVKKTNAGYTVQLSIDSGKNRIRQNKTFVTRREANEWLTQQSAILGGSKALLYQRKMTVMSFYDLWVANKKNGLAKNTQKSYLATRKRLSPYLSLIKVSTLTHQQLQGVFNMLSKRYSHETLRKDLGHIRSMLRYAMRISVVTAKVNPADDVVITGNDDSYYKNVDDKVLPLSEFNVIKEYLIRFAIKKNDWHTRNMLGLSIAISTGLRGGEILALRYKDIDFSECILTVNHSWDGELVAPKTKNGVRKVPVSRDVMNKITTWVRYQRREMFRRGLYNPDRLIFLNYKGKIPPASGINLTYKRLQKRLGLPGTFSTHTMRHTIASMMLNSGEISLVYISRFLGHSNISITQKYYIDLLPDQVTNEDKKVVKLLALA